MLRSDWLSWRRGGLCGSDIAAIQPEGSVSPWASEWDIFLAKRHRLDLDDRDDSAKATGRRLEKTVGEWAAEELGMKLHNGQPIATHWGRGTPDNFLSPPDWPRGTVAQALMLGLGCTGLHGLECKVAPYPWPRLPEHYDLQCRWYMALTDLDVWHLAAFFRSAPDWRLYRIDRDLGIEKEMVDHARQWWQRHVVEGVPPEVDGSRACTVSLGLLHPVRNKFRSGDRGLRPLHRVADEREEALARDYASAKQMAQSYGDRKDLLRNQLFDAIGDDGGFRFTGGFARRTESNKLTVRIRE